MGSWFAHRMLVVLSLYMIFYTTFIGIGAAAMTENNEAMSAYPGGSMDYSTVIATDGGLQYLPNSTTTTYNITETGDESGSGSTLDVTHPKATYSWVKTLWNLLLGSNTDIYSDSTFLTANMYIIRFMFWIPLIMLVFAAVFSILG